MTREKNSDDDDKMNLKNGANEDLDRLARAAASGSDIAAACRKTECSVTPSGGQIKSAENPEAMTDLPDHFQLAL